MSGLGWPDARSPRDAALPIVLVPSLGTTSTLFDGLAREIALRLPDASIILADLPGHGSGPLASTVSVEALADDLAAHVAAAPRRALVIGVSMGGAIALEAARRHPGRIAGVVQVNSGAQFGSAEGWQGLIDTVTKGGTARLTPSSETGWFAEGFRGSAIARELLDEVAGIDDDSYIACCRALAGYDGAHDLERLDVPALLIGTADDGATPAFGMRVLSAQLPRGAYAELPAGGHLSVAEHPGWIAERIAVWAGEEVDA